MKRILFFTVAFMLVCGFLTTPTFSQVEKTVFGPEQYSPIWWKPVVFSETFSTGAEAEGSVILGTLVVETGQKRVLRWWKWPFLRAEIRLNGRRILHYKDMNWKVPKVEIPVKLKQDNKLVIKLIGIPKNYVTVKIDYIIGPTGPIFSGPQQYPFLCRTETAGLGQPLVDNQEGLGIAVYEEDENGDPNEDEIVGYCKDCSMPTRIDYFYRSTDGNFYRFDHTAPLPADLDTTTTSDGLTVDYIVRLERGTINRFIYGIAMLAPFDHLFDHLSKSYHPYFRKGKKCRSMWNTHAWNKKLVYQFQGGVAIGHQQADSWGAGMIAENGQFERGPMNPDLLGKGYAVAFSTGTVTNTHYNMILSAETMMMVKEHFTASYGDPIYTVGVGGSGGAIQQYFIGQNYPGLLDAVIPQYSYSDMITQTIYVGDCSLMEFYFEAVAPALGDVTFGGINLSDFSWLGSVEPRTWIEGMSSNDEEYHPIYKYYGHKGSTSCVNGWLGLLPLCMNPLWTDTAGLDKLPPEVVAEVKWTHWNDLENVYGVDENGYPPFTWDNVGVQYGLQALKDGLITKDQFLTLNAAIGGWKRPQDMVQEGYPFYGTDPNDFDPWSARNKTGPDQATGIAPRTEGDLDAMHAAYTSGHVFVGNINIPVIDFRNYLDPQLDMHHAMQSFATRQRMRDGQGSADNQLIWFADPGYDLTPYAFELLDEWLYNIRHKIHGEGVVANKPAQAVDLCVDYTGTEIASGDGVWDGILNDTPDGACTKAFQLHSTSRIVAGGDIKGDVFKCFRQPVEDAIDAGVYGDVEFDSAEIDRLRMIFADGVCDYSQGDMGRP